MIVIAALARRSADVPVIPTIKALRAATGMGLKEAKDLVDNTQHRSIRIRLTAEQLGVLIARLDTYTDLERRLPIHDWWDLFVVCIEDLPKVDYDAAR